jgi:hypothetical protein
MSEKKQQQAEIEVKDYAGGWITEKKGTQVPGFLKLAFPIIGIFSAGYLIVFMNGEITHSDRGALVQALNKATGGADSLMYAVLVLALVFLITVVSFAFRKSH